MEDIEFESAPTPTRPKTATVVILLALTAAILSYLASYATANALVAADLIKAWPSDHDPRPRWFMTGFVVLISLFLIIAAAARMSSQRHLKRIEAMEDEESLESSTLQAP